MGYKQLEREIDTPVGRLTAHVLRSPRGSRVVWAVECPTCGRQSDLTSPQLRGEAPLLCGTQGCPGGRPVAYSSLIEAALSPETREKAAR